MDLADESSIEDVIKSMKGLTADTSAITSNTDSSPSTISLSVSFNDLNLDLISTGHPTFVVYHQDGVEALMAIRLKLLNSNVNLAEFVDLFVEAWQIISNCKTIRESLGISRVIPIFYQSKQIKRVMERILNPVFRHIHGPLIIGSGGSIIINGPVGVGKTTLISVISVLLNCLLADLVISIYCDYSDSNSVLPSTLLMHALGHNGDNLKELLAKSNRMVVFCADEIQCLYVVDTNKHNIEIVEQLAIIGKSTGHIGVATGSSINTVDFAHWPDSYGFSGYHSLNHSVYEEELLLPVRDKAEFVNLISTLGPKRKWLDSDITLLFHVTGGVGRSVNKCVGLTIGPDIPASIVKFADNLAVREITLRMLSKIFLFIGDVKLFNYWKHNHAISRSECLELIKCCGFENEEVILRQLCDQSIFLVKGCTIEVVNPALLTYMAEVCNVNTDPFATMALLSTLTGWTRDNTGSFPSAGHKNEELILAALFRLDVNMTTVSNQRDVVVKSNSKLHVNDVVNKWVQGSSSQVGVEGFCVTGQPGEYEITYVQVKTGRVEMQYSTKDLETIVSGCCKGAARMIATLTGCENFSKRIVVATTKRLPAELPQAPSDFELVWYSLEDLMPILDVSNEIKNVIKNRYACLVK